MDYKDQVIKELETMRLGETAAGERFKALAYKKAIDNIRRLTDPLTTVEQLKGVEGIGKKIYDKVAEIIQTGSLRAAESMKARTDVAAYETLLGVHGIGPVKARELLTAGYTTIASLRTGLEKTPGLLNDIQKLGLKYYEHGIQRIPRAEMTEHERRLLSGLPVGLTGIIVGSYRRGAETSGDIDMLVSYPEAVTDSYAQTLFGRLIRGLSDYIVDVLASGPKKWMGYVRLPGCETVRRLDLLLTPPLEYPYAILYFTGSDKFNIAFRRWCLEKGYTLNEHGMTPTGGKPVPPTMSDESAIFTFVGLQYVAPTARTGAEALRAI